VKGWRRSLRCRSPVFGRLRTTPVGVFLSRVALVCSSLRRMMSPRELEGDLLPIFVWNAGNDTSFCLLHAQGKISSLVTRPLEINFLGLWPTPRQRVW
jgi:hypothetical protein